MRSPHSVLTVALLCALSVCASASQNAGGPHVPKHRSGITLTIAAARIFAGSRIPYRVDPPQRDVRVALIGPGHLEFGEYVAPDRIETATAVSIVAAAPGENATAHLTVAPYPPSDEPLVAVASYDAGIALHRRGDLQLEGVVPIPEGVADVAYDPKSRIIYALAARGTKLFALSRDTWELHVTDGVELGNELAVDAASTSVFITDRDVGGDGALTRVGPGRLERVVTGKTAEGIALDARRSRVYVGNVNGDDIAEIDARSLALTRTIPTITRPFGLALDEARRRLFVVSNEPAQSHTIGPSVAAIDLAAAKPRVLARSEHFAFPLGVAYDALRDRVFVTDEGAALVYVLSARTLAAVHAPLHTCNVPWRPAIDLKLRRLYIPCARSGALAAFDLETLREFRAPIGTGGYPLGVTTVD